MPPTAPLLRLEHVSRTFDQGHMVAVRDVSLELHHGELASLVGPSGCGKTTLLGCMAGLDAPTSGRILFEGAAGLSPAAWARLRSRRIGIGFQDFNLLPTLTASENIEVAMFATVRSPAERRRRAHDLLAEVGLAPCARRRPQELSGGERRRVALARSIANAPDLLLVDEPTSNLDRAAGAATAELLLALHAARRVALLIVTHDGELAARCPRRIAMVDGRVAADSGPPRAAVA